jgi:DNA-binding transcriptional LysR family regulator
MQDLNDMVTFARVVEANGFSEAARRMGVSKSGVSKSVAKLERALGVRLLNRSTRGLSLTEIVRAFHEQSQRIDEESEQATELADELQSEPRGKLRISASVAFGRLHVAPAVVEYLARNPRMTIDMTVTDRLVDLIGEGYDVAIRIERQPSLHLVARELTVSRRVVCGTPEYFKRHGVPATPQELTQHNCLRYTQFGAPRPWHFKNEEGDAVVQVYGSLCLDDHDVLSQAVLGGLGIALLPTFIIGRELRSGRLMTVLEGYAPPQQRVYAIHLPTAHLPKKTRGFIGFLQARFGEVPYWDRMEDAAPLPVLPPP